MGADLITYTICLPEKGTRKLVDNELARIDAAIGKLDRDAIINDEKGWDILCDTLKLNAFAYENEMGEQDAERLWDMVVADLELAEGFDEKFSARDCGGGTWKVAGKRVYFLHAGEMSFGDTPEGLGYQTIGAIWRLGIGELLEKLVAKR